jgi:hypothetical protein
MIVECEPYRQLVVKIDPIGKLLPPIIGADGNSGEARQVGPRRSRSAAVTPA